MATGRNVRTWYQGTWHEGDVMIMRAADHGAWQGSTVFDGARQFEGVAPDLERHCARVNASARALMLKPHMAEARIVEIVREGLALYPRGTPVYIRPMYWGIDSSHFGIVPGEGEPGFCVCLEEIPLAPAEKSLRLTTTRFRRPILENAVTNAKAGCLYPNNARMIAEAVAKGYDNALVADAMGNVAETATSNIFLVKDGEVFTPIANGTFLSGITRARHIANLRADGVPVHEAVLTFDHFRAADEVFMSGNLNKVTPVAEFDGTMYQHGPMTRRVRALYWDWALSR